MKKIKILSISNSFGVNLNAFASQIAKANGLDLDIYVLYIGGCSLATHAKNIRENNKAYLLYHNGVSTEKMVSILDGLKLEEEWDYVLTQQASHFSGKIETYEPHFSFIYNFVKENTKFTKFGWQETWAYGPNMNAPENRFGDYNRDSELMYNQIHNCVSSLLDKMPDLFIINSGDIVRSAIPVIKANLYDDFDFHMSSAGCYLIGTNFVKLLLGESIKNIYVPEGHPLDKNLCTKITEFVNKQSSFIKENAN